MKGRLLTLVLLAILLILQAHLWIGEGSVGQQRQLKQQIEEQKALNQELEERNETILLEIRSLDDNAENNEGVEERARSELGMVEEDEVFYMMVEDAVEDPIEPPVENLEE